MLERKLPNFSNLNAWHVLSATFQRSLFWSPNPFPLTSIEDGFWTVDWVGHHFGWWWFHSGRCKIVGTILLIDEYLLQLILFFQMGENNGLLGWWENSKWEIFNGWRNKKISGNEESSCEDLHLFLVAILFGSGLNEGNKYIIYIKIIIIK